KAAAVLMGSPKLTSYAEELIQTYKQSGDLHITDEMAQDVYELLAPYDLSRHMEVLNDRPLFFWHGKNDSVVPFAHAYSFYRDVLKHYRKQENIQFLPEKNREHKVSRLAILETVQWFDKHL